MLLPFLAAISALLRLLGHPRQQAAASPSYGERVIQSMHDRYAGKWYEAASFPGKLRIDIAPLDSMTAFLYVGVFRHGRARRRRRIAIS
jgi:hypothetical protein